MCRSHPLNCGAPGKVVPFKLCASLTTAASIASKYSSVKMAQIDIDESDGLKKKYNVTSIPAAFAFKNGKQSQRYGGPLVKDGEAEDFTKKAV